MKTEINWSFIGEREGGSVRSVYVPDPEKSKSGPTVAKGFDIGQRSPMELRQLLPEKIAKKLQKYCGITGIVARDYVNLNPTTLSKKECETIDAAVKSQAVERLVSLWKDHGNPGYQFCELPEAMQTVMASVAFQYGNLLTETPKFWSHCAHLDCESIISELKDFGDRYPTRRKIEAKYLEDYVNGGDV